MYNVASLFLNKNFEETRILTLEMKWNIPDISFINIKTYKIFWKKNTVYLYQIRKVLLKISERINVINNTAGIRIANLS